MNSMSNVITKLNKYKYPILIMVIGIILMVLPMGGGSKTITKCELTDDERRVEAVLTKVDGVGPAKVLISDSGVVVVCAGADIPGVKLNIINAIRSFTGFSSDKITILKISYESLGEVS